MTDRLHLRPKHRKLLDELLRKHLPEVEAWAYGSRVNGRSHDGSDLDLILRAPDLKEISISDLVDFEEAVRDSTIPFLVEARDWARVPERFHPEIERRHVILTPADMVKADPADGASIGRRDGAEEQVLFDRSCAVDPARPPEDQQWQRMSFAEAVVINPTVRLERGESYPFVDMAAVTAGSRCVHAADRRVYSGGGSRFQRGDTLMARITPCLENGKTARYCTDDPLTEAHGSTEFIVIRGRAGVTDSEYAYYLTQWDGVRSYAIDQMTGTSGRQRVPVDSLTHLSVPVPPVSEQRAIAHILGTLDHKIELNRRMNQTLEAMARAIFKDWFADFGPVRAKMEGRDPYLPPDIWKLFPDRLVDSDLGEIPEGWEPNSLDSLAHFQNGLALQKYRPSQNEARLPVLKIAQLRTGHANGGEWASAAIKPECIVEDGDVVFSWSGSLLVQIWCGGRAALNQHLFKVTSDSYPKWFYLHSLLSHLPNFRRIASGKATTMGHIRRSHLSEALCPVPPHHLVVQATGLLGRLMEQQIGNKTAEHTLAALRDGLLPKLIAGDIHPETGATVGSPVTRSSRAATTTRPLTE